MRKSAFTRINEGVKALALCHNVTPVFEAEDDASAAEAEQNAAPAGAAGAAESTVTYQASSPDEVALVSWSEEMGLALVDREE